MNGEEESLRLKMESAARASYDAFRRAEEAHAEAMRLAGLRDQAMNDFVRWKVAHSKAAEGHNDTGDNSEKSTGEVHAK